MQKEFMDKNVVVFRGSAREAIDIQLCKMGIAPYSVRGDVELSIIKKENAIGKHLVEGLSLISKEIGRAGLEEIMYKKYGGLYYAYDVYS